MKPRKALRVQKAERIRISEKVTGSISISNEHLRYYIDPVNGNDAWSGYEGSPWKTITKVNAAALVPGKFDELIIAAGGARTLAAMRAVK